MLSKEAPVLFDQLTFKSLLQDHKEETPDKGIQDRSNHLTPILSLAVDALVQSPDSELVDANKIRLHISDFELKHLERRVTNDLFSSTKKKNSCNFDGLTLDSTCSNSFEAMEEPKVLAIYDQIFASSEPHKGIKKGLSLCLDSPLESPLTTKREETSEPQVKPPRKLKLADFVDEETVSNNLLQVVESVKAQLENRYNSLSAHLYQGNPLKVAKKKTEGRFSLF